jgi:hypothetical protein
MARTIPKIPDATTIFEGVTIGDMCWRRIEGAYGCKLSADVREQLHQATEDYVRSAGFELELAGACRDGGQPARSRPITGPSRP